MLPHHQPWKTFYLLCLVVSIVVKVPFWTLRTMLFPSSRPNRSWSTKKTVSLYVTRQVLSQFAKLQLGIFDNDVDIPDGTYKNTKFVRIEGEREEDIHGQIKEYARRAHVEPLRTSAFWYYRRGTLTRTIEQPKAGEKVIYYIHGGAFFHGTAHPKGTYACIPNRILRHSKSLTRILAIDYHLSSSAPYGERHPFPTAILDLIAGYRYLLELGFTSENITVAGDSAGGNLALALLRYLKETAVLPMPGRLILLSFWGDISASNNGPNSSLRRNLSDIFAHTQTIMEENFAGYGIRSYLGSAFDFDEDAKTNPYMSPTSLYIKPVRGEYQGYPKTLIIVGSLERILDDSIIMADYLRKDNPDDSDHATVHIANAAVHDFLLFSWAEPERTEAFLRIAKWLDE